jgi:N-acetylneuraminate lyase
MKFSEKKITGLIAATFTPFNKDHSVNTAMIPTIVEKMINDGLAGIFVCGTNGEGPNLTIEERIEIATEYVKHANKRIAIIVHVGHTSIAESKKLAVHAQSIGADAISSVAAFYFKPSSIENLVQSIAETAAAAPDLPYYYYHIPSLTGVSIDMIDFLKLAADRIPNLVGVKFSSSALHEYMSCLVFQNGRFDVLWGYDEMLLGALAIGAKGAVGSTFCFAAPLYLKVISLYKDQNMAEATALQYKLVEMVRRVLKYPLVPTQRAVMKMLGFDFGTCRLPLNDLTEHDFEALKQSLNEIGFFELLEENAQAIKAEKEKTLSI